MHGKNHLIWLKPNECNLILLILIVIDQIDLSKSRQIK